MTNNVFGFPAIYNSDATFYKDVYIYGNLFYESDTVTEFNDITVNHLTVRRNASIGSTLGIGTIFSIIPYDGLNNGTLSFEASAGQIFSLTNNLTEGSIFSVNDVSGVPIIDVDAEGNVEINPYGGSTTFGESLGIGTANPQALFHVNNTTSQNTVLIEDSTNPDSTPLIIDNQGRLGIGTTDPTLVSYFSNQFYTADPNNKIAISNGNVSLVSSGNQGGTYAVGPYMSLTGIGYDPANPASPIDTYPQYQTTCYSNLDYSAGEFGFYRGGVTNAGVGTIPPNVSGDVVGYIHARVWSGVRYNNAAQIRFDINNRNIGAGNHASADIIFTGRESGNVNQYAAYELGRFEGDTGNLLLRNEIQSLSNKPILRQSGSIIQTVYSRTNAVNTYSSPNTGNGTTITDLGITITPVNANNRIIIQWYVTYEVSNQSVFLIHRDGSLITDAGEEGYNPNFSSASRWNGYSISPFDTDTNSTPSNQFIMYSEIAASTTARTYALATRSSTASNHTFCLNRTVNAAAQDDFERGVSSVVAYEVVV